MFRRPFLRRRRLLGAAMLGGLGYLVGRRRSMTTVGEAAQDPSVSDRLADLDSLRDNDEITEAEYAAKRKELLGEL